MQKLTLISDDKYHRAQARTIPYVFLGVFLIGGLIVLFLLSCGGCAPAAGSKAAEDAGYTQTDVQTFQIDTAGLGVSFVSLVTVEYDSHKWIIVARAGSDAELVHHPSCWCANDTD